MARSSTKINWAVRTITSVHSKKADKALRLLDGDFRYPGLHSHPVESAPGIFEAYVDIQYRMTFERRGEILLLRNIDNHDDCLKNPY